MTGSEGNIDWRSKIDWDEFQFHAALVLQYLKAVDAHLPVGMKSQGPEHSFSWMAWQELDDQQKHYFFVCALSGAARGQFLAHANTELGNRIEELEAQVEALSK